MSYYVCLKVQAVEYLEKTGTLVSSALNVKYMIIFEHRQTVRLAATKMKVIFKWRYEFH